MQGYRWKKRTEPAAAVTAAVAVAVAVAIADDSTAGGGAADGVAPGVQALDKGFSARRLACTAPDHLINTVPAVK